MILSATRVTSSKPFKSHLYQIITDTELYYVRVPATWTTPQVRSALKPHVPRGHHATINWAPNAEAAGVKERMEFK